MKEIRINGNKYNSFKKWIDTYFIPITERRIDHAILNSTDIYSLRCKILHEGTLNIKNPDLTRIIFSTGGSHRNKLIVNNNQISITEIQLNPLLFVEEIVICIEKWISNKQPEETMLDFNITDTFSSLNLNGLQAVLNCK